MAQAPSPSFITAITLLDTLVRAGMRHVLVSPGSRSAPLTYAAATLAEAGIIQAHVRIDERTASFTALGIAKATGSPVGIITTSGTAVGQCLPALMEAYHTGTPLALLSADRPSHLQGTGSNQTTRQTGIFGQHVRAFAHLENYRADPADPQSQQLNLALAALTGRSAQAWEEAATSPQGPVHLNIGLDAPLTPGPLEADILTRWAESLKNLPTPTSPQRPAHQQAQSWLQGADLPTTSHRTVIMAGDGAGAIAQQAAQKLGLPLLAEPSSQARYSPLAIEAYRQVLDGPLSQQIDRVLIMGHPTLSRPQAALLANSGIERRLYSPDPAPWHEPEALGFPTLTSLAEAAAFTGHGHTPEGRAWLTAWQEAGQAQAAPAHQAISRYREAPTSATAGDQRAAARSLALDAWQACREDGAALLLGSSSLIRDLDLLAPSAPTSPQVYANRGLAGIDGTLATAAGISLGLNRPVRVLCGDLTFLHDASSLNIGPLEAKPRVEVLVYDDRGGGIFSSLEHGTLAKDPQFTASVERFFTTPHGADLEALARAWGDNGYTLTVRRA